MVPAFPVMKVNLINSDTVLVIPIAVLRHYWGTREKGFILGTIRGFHYGRSHGVRGAQRDKGSPFLSSLAPVLHSPWQNATASATSESTWRLRMLTNILQLTEQTGITLKCLG